MDLSIRKYIKNNFKNSEKNELEESIKESILSDDEVVLPGLGVLFEMLWNSSDNNLKGTIVNIIFEQIKN